MKKEYQEKQQKKKEKESKKNNDDKDNDTTKEEDTNQGSNADEKGVIEKSEGPSAGEVCSHLHSFTCRTYQKPGFCSSKWRNTAI